MRNYYASLISWSSVMIVVFACFTLNVNFIIASIFIAAIMDMFDGKVARKYSDNKPSTQLFGELTDSLCDIINFGFVAGVFLPLLQFESSYILMFFCSIYIICSIFRLARFSSLKHAGVTDYVGLPITVSGPLLSLFVLCNNIFIFLCSIVCLSILMVINIKVKKINLGE